MDTKNPHDKLFKYTLSIKSEAVALVKNFLSPELRDSLDFRTFKQENTSYITGKLEEYFSDIVWSCRLNNGKKIKITFLLEHKSYFDKKVIIQFLRYLTEAYDTMLNKEKEDKITLIVPVLVYHGKQKWSHRSLADLINIGDKKLLKYLPTFDFELIDLNTTTEKKVVDLREGYLLRSTFLLFQNIGNADYVWQMHKELFIFAEEELTEHEIRSFVSVLLTYISRTHKFSKEESTKYVEKMKDEIWANDVYLPGSTWEQALSEGMVKGGKRGQLIKVLQTSMKLMKKFPNFLDIEVADLATTEENIVKNLRKILKQSSPKKVKKSIMATFFKELKLTEKQEVELMSNIDLFYKKT